MAEDRSSPVSLTYPALTRGALSADPWNAAGSQGLLAD